LAQGPYYVEARLVMGDTSIWKNVSIDAQSSTTIRFDLDQIYNEDFKSYDSLDESIEMRSLGAEKTRSNTMLYDGSAADPVGNVPMLVTTIYKTNPTSLPAGDVASLLQNIVYYDYEFLQVKVDQDYAFQHALLWQEVEMTNILLKPVQIIVGAAFMLSGAAACGTGLGALAGVPAMVFGADMIWGSILGISVLDKVLSSGLRLGTYLSGQDTSFIDQEGFSFFQFTSSSIVNIILTQLTFMALGGLLSGFSGMKLTAKQMVTGLDEAELAFLGNTAMSVSRLSRMDIKTVLKLLLREYMEVKTGWVSSLSSIEALSYLVVRSEQYNLLLRTILSQLKHFAFGTVFLLGASALGSTSLMGGLFVNGLMLSMSILHTVGLRTISNDFGGFLSGTAIHEWTPITKLGSRLWSALKNRFTSSETSIVETVQLRWLFESALYQEAVVTGILGAGSPVPMLPGE
ncbi:MAG: hypothetical protein P1Q69_14315, partial [Candidatus Thorarchaeota archaeon]|nr:hypothetical protein [Candidatus Thorarchaeota archaeon]